MSIKIKFEVFGLDTLLPPDVTLPNVPKIGDKIKYFNPNKNTDFVVQDIHYVIRDSEVFAQVLLREQSTKK